MLKRFPSCWPTMSRILCRCPNSEAKRPWRWWGTWTWAKGEDCDGFEVDWGAWTDWSWRQGVWGWRVEGAASGINWTRNCEDACWLGCDLKEKKRSLSARLQGLICSCRPQGLVHHHLYYWTVDMMFQMTHLQSDSKCLLLKLPMSIFFWFFISMNTFCLCQNGFSGTTCPILNLHVWENLSQLMFPVLKPITMYFWGWTYHTLQCQALCFKVTSLTLQSVHLWKCPSLQRVGYFHFPVPRCISFSCTSCFDC
jgi:hypothetical protein